MSKNGRPLKFKTPATLGKKCEEYFKSCWKGEGDEAVQIKPYTITGLALYLGTSRETLMNYENRDKFFDTIKKAKLRCENYAEEMLLAGKNPGGAIFALKNYGWKDKVEQEVTGSTIQKVQYEVVYPDKKKK